MDFMDGVGVTRIKSFTQDQKDWIGTQILQLEPFNLLRITEFFGDANEATDVLPQVHDYINTLCYQADISQYMRLHPFGLRDDYTLERPPSA
ncbi:hypothetical protein BN1723_016652 [Verticillium longisporum]|uniref:Uncharacterized protein n=1 Tax=Verticillium longisporum TaxID=100787 RepID=A0A0G4NIA1_VERLO|nr:hypothetical protein BN1723_016652 [Verticillium longisporum]